MILRSANYSLRNIHLGINIRYDSPITGNRDDAKLWHENAGQGQALPIILICKDNMIEGDKLNSWLKEIENPSHVINRQFLTGINQIRIKRAI